MRRVHYWKSGRAFYCGKFLRDGLWHAFQTERVTCLNCRREMRYNGILPSTTSVRVAVLKCSAHGFYCVAIGDKRITPSKCCGQWDVTVYSSKRVESAEIRAAVKLAMDKEHAKGEVSE